MARSAVLVQDRCNVFIEGRSGHRQRAREHEEKLHLLSRFMEQPTARVLASLGAFPASIASSALRSSGSVAAYLGRVRSSTLLSTRPRYRTSPLEDSTATSGVTFAPVRRARISQGSFSIGKL